MTRDDLTNLKPIPNALIPHYIETCQPFVLGAERWVEGGNVHPRTGGFWRTYDYPNGHGYKQFVVRRKGRYVAVKAGDTWHILPSAMLSAPTVEALNRISRDAVKDVEQHFFKVLSWGMPKIIERRMLGHI